jgi:CubicO group peptidase (beta-lactamase class C family)
VTAWDAAALEDLATYARGQRTTGLRVVHDGRAVLSRDWPLPAGCERFARLFVHGTAAGGSLREDVASQQKSVVALLAAMAVDRGRLDVEEPVGRFVGRGWSRAAPAQEDAIRVRHLLEMSSGLDDALRFAFPAGAHHRYNTPAYAVLLPVLEAATGQPLEDITRDWLTGPAGMTDTGWCRRDPELAGDFGNPRGLVTTPGDLVRLGQLVLDDGLAADGTRLVSRAGLAALFRRTALHPAYGWLWWLNGGSHWVMPNKGEGPGSVCRHRGGRRGVRARLGEPRADGRAVAAAGAGAAGPAGR